MPAPVFLFRGSAEKHPSETEVYRLTVFLSAFQVKPGDNCHPDANLLTFSQTSRGFNLSEIVVSLSSESKRERMKIILHSGQTVKLQCLTVHWIPKTCFPFWLLG